MGLLSRPWFRLTAVGVLTVVGFIVFGVVVALMPSKTMHLPYDDTLVGTTRVLREWDTDITRARYVSDGYELLVKQQGRTASALPDIYNDWDITVRVTLEFRALGGSWSDDAPGPTAGVVCTGDDVDYDIRIGVDGRYAVYRWSRAGRATLLASNSTLAKPRLVVRGPMTVLVVCQRRSPTTVRLTVDGTELLSVQDTDARNWGKAGLIVGSGSERNVAAVFRDLSISGY